MSERFDINVTDKNKCVARIFWTAKLHKTPYKARFIAGANKCSTKQISLHVNKALKVLKDYFSKYCRTIYKNVGINHDWSINSSTQFLSKIQHLDVYNMQVYDFTTLYTNLDLGVVGRLLSEMIDLIYSNINKYICVCKYNENCFFSKKEYNGYHCFSKEKLCEAIDFILQNTYISFAGTILRQCKGIPMGGNSSSQLADLSLAMCEYKYMDTLIKDKEK